VLVHLNGQLVPAESAKVSVFDRGFLFGDGVYEGLRSTAGPAGPEVVGLDLHIQRMRDGLEEARIRGFDPARLGPIIRELLEAQGLVESFIYSQVTRGTPTGKQGTERPRVVRQPGPPTVLAYAMPLTGVSDCRAPECKKVALRPDTRWTRGRLKSISLLGGVLAAIEADEQGADDAIMFRDGLITEGTATNVFLKINGEMVTPSLDSAPILAGVTRALILRDDPAIRERPVRVEELSRAEEVMLVGTKTMVVSISQIDGTPVGASASRAFGPGPASIELLQTLKRAIDADIRAQHARRIAAASPAARPAGAARHA